MRPYLLLLRIGVLVLSSTVSALAVINPALQPDVYYEKYDNVLVLQLEKMDPTQSTLQCSIAETIKGAYPAGESITITFAGALSGQVTALSESGRLKPGDQFPVFAGKPSRRKSNRQVRLYIGEFFVGEVDEKNQFTVGIEGEMETDSEGGKVNTLAGIYNGMTSEFIHMLQDMAANRDFYPRKAYVKFKEDTLVAKLDQSIEGVAMFDLNGDGMEDLVACSPGGDRIYQQVEPMKFSDVTESFGISSSSVSCSVADADCDGLADILLGTTLYQGSFKKGFQFKATDWLQVDEKAPLKSASFIELNGDGYPDIIASFEGAGLRAYLNPGKAGGAFSDASAKLKLPTSGNGYITSGDWNDDNRTDLFYADGNGFLLVQSEDGSFNPQSHQIDFIFRTGVDTYGQTGAGVFMPTYQSDKMDMVIPIEKDWLITIGNDEP
ncbi:MAG: VCBS repeat-containing protein, partial [Verrucomicrobiota bacterium]